MKTIMVIDGAENCAYDCFLASDRLFDRLYPGEGQDIEFMEDFQEREGDALNDEFLNDEFDAMWGRPVRRKDVVGIDGLLFYRLLEKKTFYPNKMDSDLDGTGRARGTEA